MADTPPESMVQTMLADWDRHGSRADAEAILSLLIEPDNHSRIKAASSSFPLEQRQKFLRLYEEMLRLVHGRLCKAHFTNMTQAKIKARKEDVESIKTVVELVAGAFNLPVFKDGSAGTNDYKARRRH